MYLILCKQKHFFIIYSEVVKLEFLFVSNTVVQININLPIKKNILCIHVQSARWALRGRAVKIRSKSCAPGVYSARAQTIPK